MSSLGEIVKKLRNDRGMSQAALAKAAKMGQSDISKIENGTMRETTAIVRLAMALNASPVYLETGDDRYSSMDAFEIVPVSKAESPDDIYIPITNAAGSMGYGVLEPNFEEVVSLMRVTRSWLKTELSYVTSPDNLAVLPAIGPSMEPTFHSGDLLLVDRGVHEIRNDAIYVFSLNGHLFVKRIVRNPITETLTAKSDNALHGSFDIDKTQADALTVLGMIVYAWNAKKL